jgi:hypothetical protein
MHVLKVWGAVTANAIIQHRSRDLGTDGYSSKEAGIERIRKSREALARSYELLLRLNGQLAFQPAQLRPCCKIGVEISR